jgi:hypothetical protein
MGVSSYSYRTAPIAALRSSVSMAAGEFKRDGLIIYSRGQLEILDRPGLERRACECCRSDLEDLSQLLHMT